MEESGFPRGIEIKSLADLRGRGGVLLEIHMADLPVSWKRTRGDRVRYKVASLAAWQEYVCELAKEEIMLRSASEAFPYDGYVRVSVLVLFADEAQLRRFADFDNTLKGVVDALSGVVYPDDCPRYVLGGECHYSLASDPSLVGTHVVVTRAFSDTCLFSRLG